jgi:hypothetical protein
MLSEIQDDVKEGEHSRLVSRFLVVLACTYVAYIGLTCPCKEKTKNGGSTGLYKCHLMEMYIGIMLVVAILMSQNGLRFFSYTD